MTADLRSLTADIVIAHAGRNRVNVEDLPTLISSVYRALSNAAAPLAPAIPAQHPAVPIKSSIKPGYIVSLEDGRKFKTLKKHLMASHSMTPDDYRRKWGLPADYPMIAPNYANQRSALAKKIGLGSKRGRPATKASTAAPARSVKAKVTPKKRRTKATS